MARRRWMRSSREPCRLLPPTASRAPAWPRAALSPCGPRRCNGTPAQTCLKSSKETRRSESKRSPMRFDHVAIPSKNIPQSIEWYRTHFNATVLYQDATWAFLQVGGTKLALVTSTQHPPHFAFSLTEEALRDAAALAKVQVEGHRDGTKGIYLHDPDGNAVELINYPPGETVYAQRGK